MSLSYKVGDLIKAAQEGEVNVIGHGCNCYCTMGSGIAPLIKAAFPKAFAADQNTTKGSVEKLGTYSIGGVSSGLLVYNLYSQHGFWGRNKGLRDLDYNALYNALDAMAKNLIVRAVDLEEFRVGFPKIGAGLAGGSWHVVQAMIEDTFVKRGITTTIYVLDAKEIPAGGLVNV